MLTQNIHLIFLPKGAQSHHVFLLVAFTKTPGGGSKVLQF